MATTNTNKKVPFISASDVLQELKVYNLQQGDGDLQRKILMALRILDMQDAYGRYRWYNLPNGLTPRLIERVLYFRGQGCIFYIPELDKFFFLPYSLFGDIEKDVGIDCYGRYIAVTPMTMGTDYTNAAGKKIKKKGREFITDYHLQVLYDEMSVNEPGILKDRCVLLGDYSKAISQYNTPRSIIQQPFLEAMSEVVPYCMTMLVSNTGVQGIRVQDEDEADNVAEASEAMKGAALTKRPFVPIQGKLDFQQLSGGAPLKAEDYLLILQALDNLRLSFYGLATGGLFQKKSHMLEAEQNMNAGHAKSPLQDGLELRQEFCDRCNALWGLGMWCEISETALGMDKDGDGMAADSSANDGAGQNPMPQTEGGDEDAY